MPISTASIRTATVRLGGAARRPAGRQPRWPLARHSGGVTHIIEPVAQLIWSPKRDYQDEVPNEDSYLLEFDEGNLFSLNRFSGWDARESGLRANLGLGWTRIDPAGWSIGLTAGRVLRSRPDRNIADNSPIGGKKLGLAAGGALHRIERAGHRQPGAA